MGKTMTNRSGASIRLQLGAFLLWMVCALPMPAAAIQMTESTLYGRTLLEQINRYRQEHGLSQLTFDTGLIRVAKAHSFTMFQQKRISHLDFNKRFERSGSRLCVENVGWNYTVPLKQFEAWRWSSGHDQNMLADGLRKAGIAEVNGYVTFFACQ